MAAGLIALAYLACGVLFILALRGLSSPESAPRGNVYGMAGMALAILTTLWVSGIADGLTFGLIALAAGIGGAIGAVVALRIAMTAMPQLVAAFHSLVGLAAVLVASAALLTNRMPTGLASSAASASRASSRCRSRVRDRGGDLLGLGGGLHQAPGAWSRAVRWCFRDSTCSTRSPASSCSASRCGSAPPSRTLRSSRSPRSRC